MTTATTTSEVSPIRGTCPICGGPTTIRPAGPLASAGPTDVIRIGYVERCDTCGYRQVADPSRSVALEGGAGPVGEDLRAALDAPPIDCTCPATACGLPAVCVLATNPGELTWPWHRIDCSSGAHHTLVDLPGYIKLVGESKGGPPP
jgi:hypothetical protein